MSGHLRPGRRTPSSAPGRLGRLERVSTVGICESNGCVKLADWRIGYGNLCVDLCSRHTLATMRNRRVWAGWP